MTIAPPAPGRLGEAILPELLLRYLQDLDAWLVERRQELDQLDSAIQSLPPARPGSGAPDPRALTNDLMLSLTLWQAVRSRLELLTATWDSGRVGQTERERMSSLIWGRLDTTVGQTTSASPLAGMNLSLPEASRLSDALAGQLRTRLGLTPDVNVLAGRIRQLKVSMERLRDQVKLEPAETFDAARDHLEKLASRLSEIEGKLQRGGDVGGMLGPLEIDAAKFERDMIVEGAQRRQQRARSESVAEELEALRVTEKAMQTLADKAVRTVTPAPKYAVPDVDALGPLPTQAAQLDAFAARLGQVRKAMQVVQQAYSKALQDHDDLVARLEAARTKADALGLHEPAMDEIARTAATMLATSPAPMTVVRPLVDAYANHVSLATSKEGSR